MIFGGRRRRLAESRCPTSTDRIGAAVSWVEIVATERLEASPDIAGFSVDFPLPGRADGYGVRIGGWVLAAGTAPLAAVEIHLGGQLVGRLRVALVRPDVNAALALADAPTTGFDDSIHVATFPTEFALTLQAVTAAGGRIPLAVVRGRHSPLRSSFTPSLQPLLLTSLGRSGTTLLMGLLRAHPRLLVGGPLPYEMRVGAYWMHALTVLSGYANHDESSHPDAFIEQPYFIGHNPFAVDRANTAPHLRAWYGQDAVEEIAAFCQRSVEQTYLRVAADLERSGPAYFVEKTLPSRTASLFAQLYPGMREVFLVRDPRDMMSSMIAFDRQRGFDAFRHTGEGDDLDLARRLASTFGQLLREREQRDGRALLVRYEDLVRDPLEVLRRIAGHAGVEADDTLLESVVRHGTVETTESRMHRTSADSASSMNRYRDTLSVKVQDLWLELAGDLLEKVGYSSERARPD
jgi:hypothetical protein